MSKDHEEALYRSEVICDRAHILFGLILRLLCQRANITQDYLEEAGKAYRDYLIERGYLRPGYVVGALDQGAISRVINGDLWPSYDQVAIWLHVIEETLKSGRYKQVRKERGLVVYELGEDLKTDLYHLAGFGSPDEIVEAYNKRLHMTTEPPPRAPRTSGKSSPRRQGRYTRKENNHHWQEEPMEEI